MTGRMERLLGSFLLCICLGGCAAAVVGGAAGGGYYASRSDRPGNTNTADATITSTINTRYVQDKLVNALDVRVATRHGTVTLQGSVPSQVAAQRAVEIAGSVAGVTHVVNRLTVVPR